MADYKEIPLDLTNGFERSEVVSNHIGISSVTVLSLPPGATLSVHLGERQGIAVLQGFKFSHPRGCVIENQGLFVTAPAQPGVTARLYVGFGDESAQVA